MLTETDTLWKFFLSLQLSVDDPTDGHHMAALGDKIGEKFPSSGLKTKEGTMALLMGIELTTICWMCSTFYDEMCTNVQINYELSENTFSGFANLVYICIYFMDKLPYMCTRIHTHMCTRTNINIYIYINNKKNKSIHMLLTQNIIKMYWRKII